MQSHYFKGFCRFTVSRTGADPKAVRLWYKLNEKTEICVKTGVGLTEFTNVGAVVGQGTMGGALVSQAVLDEGTQKHFVPGTEDELKYGSVQWRLASSKTTLFIMYKDG